MAHNTTAAAAAQASSITQGEAHNANLVAAVVQGVVNAANNAADIVALIQLHRFIHTIVGLSQT